MTSSAPSRPPAEPKPRSDSLRSLLFWLDSHTNFEGGDPITGSSGTSAPTLTRMVELCRLLGDPQLTCPVVHVTGTNGKGSTSRILSCMLEAKGLTVGLYSSPDLGSVNERLAFDREPISDDELTETLELVRSVVSLMPVEPTRFELLTAAAFVWFADRAVDVAVVEVGLGGTWDATNVVEPEVAVVTNVSYDHVEILGPTLRDIAGEKAGIIKPGVRVVIGEQDPELVEVFRSRADEVGAAEVWYRGVEFDVIDSWVAHGGRSAQLRAAGYVHEDLFLSMHGRHQVDNAACALAAAEMLFGAPLEPVLLQEALASAEMPGRMEVLGRDPLVILDGAHNAAGVTALTSSLLEEFQVEGDTVVVVGMLDGRDPTALIQALAPIHPAVVVTCTAPSPRAVPAADLAEAARSLGLSAMAADDPADALTLARSQVSPGGMLLVTGSLYVVAEVWKILRARQ